MSEDTKETTADEQVDEETTEEVSPETDETTEEEETSDESSSKEYEDDTKAELEKEREARKKAEKALADQAFKERKQKREETPEEPQFDPEAFRASVLADARKELHEERIKDIAGSMAENESQRDLIIEIHKNRNFPAHLSLHEQLEESFLLANKKKLLGENSELKRALAARSRAQKGYATTQHEHKTAAPNISNEIQASLKNAGYQLVKGQWAKPLGNNQKLVYNPQTKKGEVVSS